MDKKLYNYFIVALLLLALSSVLYVTNQFTSSKSLDETEEKDNSIEFNSYSNGLVEGILTYDDHLLPADATKSANKYAITSGTVEYQVEKNFIKRTKSIIIGRNNNITGFGWYDDLQNKGAFYVNFGLKDFVTDSSKRDTDLLNSFNDLDIQIIATINIDISQNKVYKDVKIPVSLTINGVTKTAQLNVDLLLTDNQLSAKGTTEFLMQDFNITPPSFAGVFTVDKKIKGEFNIVAKPIDE